MSLESRVETIRGSKGRTGLGKSPAGFLALLILMVGAVACDEESKETKASSSSRLSEGSHTDTPHLTGTLSSASQVSLSWKPSGMPSAGYTISRSSDGVRYENIGSVPESTLTLLDDVTQAPPVLWYAIGEAGTYPDGTSNAAKVQIVVSFR